MSDITIHLEGLIAIIVFMLSIGVLITASLVSACLAFFAASKTREPVKLQTSFGFFLAAGILILLNLIFMGSMYLIIDNASHEFNEVIDNVSLFFWLPFQVIAFIAGGLIYRRRLKK